MKTLRWITAFLAACIIWFPTIAAGQQLDPQIPDSVRADIIESLLNEFQKKSVKNINLQECRRHLEQKSLREGIQECDTHADVYVTKEDSEDLRRLMGDSYVGVGMLLVPVQPGRFKVYPFPNSPAERAGVRDEDIILRVDSVTIDSTKTSEEVRDMVRGIKGSSVNILFERNGAPLALPLTIQRQEITFPLVSVQSLNDSILYIYIRQFGEQVPDELQKALENLFATSGLHEFNVKGIVVDVRFNPGGRADVAFSLLNDLFARTAGDTIALFYRKNDTTAFQTNRRGIMTGIPTVVLVNSLSASASEIFAGVLQEWNIATIVGDTTVKKGSVQTLFEYYLTPRTNTRIALKLTTAEYRVGNSRKVIDGVGVIPDYVVSDSIMVKLFKEDILDRLTFDLPYKRIPDPTHDPQLQKALEILSKKP